MKNYIPLSEIVLRSVGLNVPSGTVYGSGSYINSEYVEKVNVEKFQKNEIICNHCNSKNHINWDKLPAVYVLRCAACGGELE